MHKKQTTATIDNNGRRMSLANLVNAQIELKRYSETPTNLTNCRLNGAGSSLSNNTPLGSQSTVFDYSKLFGKRVSNTSTMKNEYTPATAAASPNQLDLKSNPFAFLTSTTTLAQNNCQQMSNKDRKRYSTDSQWSIDNGKDSETYGSILNRMAEAVGESESIFEYLKKATNIVYHTTVATLFIIALLLFHLAELIIGLKHLDDCPKQPKIPIYLFVGGCVGLLKSLHLMWNQMRKSSRNRDDVTAGVNLNSGIDDNELMDNEDLTLSRGSKFTDGLLSLFLAIWFIFGNYWILGIYEPLYEPLLLEPTNWCYRNLYLFSLIHLLVYYVLLILGILFILFLTIFTQIPYLIMKFQEC